MSSVRALGGAVGPVRPVRLHGDPKAVAFDEGVRLYCAPECASTRSPRRDGPLTRKCDGAGEPALRLASGVKRSDDVVDLPMLDAISRRDVAGDDIETNLSETPSVLRHPRSGGAHDPSLLGPVDGSLRAAIAVARAGLDLNKGDQRATSRNQVDLDPVVADVSLADAIPSARQKLRSALFPFRTELPTTIYARPGIA